jgi:hypothetical protein
VTKLTMMSAGNPRLQKVWDSTSLSALASCPRYYEYSILGGWTGESIDLEFGILVHSSLDVYSRARLNGASRDDAQREAVRYAFEESGTYDEEGNWTPWGGRYESFWRCEGTEPYRNDKGNRAKCPYSHAGRWHPVPAPEYCGTCGSRTHTERRWVPDHPQKDRIALVRLVVWYIEDQPLDIEQGVAPYKFPNGTHAVELPFRIAIEKQTPYGENYVLAGYLDGIKTFGDEIFVADYKTTKKGLHDAFYAGFSPSMQMDTYDLAGSILYPDLGLSGVMIEGLQVLTDSFKSGIGFLHRNEAIRQEHLKTIGIWISQAEAYAEANYWPMNKANCWRCPFASICSKSPEVREGYLKAEFKQRHWDPTKER